MNLDTILHTSEANNKEQRAFVAMQKQQIKELIQLIIEDVYYNVHGEGTSNFLEKLKRKIEEL